MQSQKRRQYTAEFKREAIRLITDHGYGVAETARNLRINARMLPSLMPFEFPIRSWCGIMEPMSGLLQWHTSPSSLSL